MRGLNVFFDDFFTFPLEVFLMTNCSSVLQNVREHCLELPIDYR